jgi:hypothetical protein
MITERQTTSSALLLLRIASRCLLDRASASNPFVWLVTDGWYWFVLREKYRWLIASGWFVLRKVLLAGLVRQRTVGTDTAESVCKTMKLLCERQILD